jgi:two-component system NarL family sensor kinase
LDRAIAEVRRVSQNLMPSELEDLGLEPALRKLCREFKERAGLRVTLRTGRLPEAVASESAMALFRIAQEALNNVGKHAKAGAVELTLSLKGKDLVLGVKDDGKGFSLEGRRPFTGRGIGLASMRERAESVGGFIQIQSAPGAGTALKVYALVSGHGGETA